VRSSALLLGLAAFLALSPEAQAQTWRRFVYEQAGFTVQFPAEPAVTPVEYRTASGQAVPATRYGVRQDGLVLSVLVADLSKLSVDRNSALADAVKKVGESGTVTLDVEERIDFEHGRELSVNGNDGSRSKMAIFFKDGRLYELSGTALPPNADGGTGPAIRFQQSLQFIPGEEYPRP
jgi:hypothetical protein